MKDFLNLGIEEVVEVDQTRIYAKSPEALQSLFQALQGLGYEIKTYSNKTYAGAAEERPGRSPLWCAFLGSDKACHDQASKLFNKPETISIYEAWHWAPLDFSEDLYRDIIYAVGMTSNCRFYNNDEDEAFKEFHLERMRRFVENFTTLPISKWNEMIEKAPKSGPSMVRAIYSFVEGFRPVSVNT